MGNDSFPMNNIPVVVVKSELPDVVLLPPLANLAPALLPSSDEVLDPRLPPFCLFLLILKQKIQYERKWPFVSLDKALGGRINFKNLNEKLKNGKFLVAKYKFFKRKI